MYPRYGWSVACRLGRVDQVAKLTPCHSLRTADDDADKATKPFPVGALREVRESQMLHDPCNVLDRRRNHVFHSEFEHSGLVIIPVGHVGEHAAAELHLEQQPG